MEEPVLTSGHSRASVRWDLTFCTVLMITADPQTSKAIHEAEVIGSPMHGKIE